jgi:hypothetical protein
MKILHLSDTTLSGAPGRLSETYNKYSGHESRHIVWHKVIYNRVFKYDMCSKEMTYDEVRKWLDWADVIHYHNRYARQEIFKNNGIKPPKKPSVIQIHSPRQSEDFSEELKSGLPIAVIAQYHVRQWPELRFIVPNVVDIFDPSHMPVERPHRIMPIISYAPSSPAGRGWDNKSYTTVSPVMRRMSINREIIYQRIASIPHSECLKLKQVSDVGIDEVSTGSYHMSSLEYLSMGVATFSGIDEDCQKVVKDLTGADWLPWIISSEKNFKADLITTIRTKSYREIGAKSREWMEKYWNPVQVCDYFTELYKRL